MGALNLRNFFLGVSIFIIACALSMLSVYGLEPKLFGSIAVFVIVLFSFMHWKQAIIFVILYAMYSGALRKWAFPQLAEMLFFFNHIVLIGVYAKYLWIQRQSQKPIFIRHSANVLLIFLLSWCVACMFNPQLTNILVGVLGFVVYFFYTPLMFVIPQVFETKEGFIKVLKLMLVFSIPMLLLGVVQFFSPVDHPINYYVSTTEVSFIGDYPRISSTFSYIAGYGTFLNILVLVLLYLMSLKNNSVNYSIFLYVMLGLTVFNSLMTGSRTSVFYSLICVVFYLFVIGALKMSSIKKVLPRYILAFILLTGMLGFTSYGKKVVNAFLSRVIHTEERSVKRILDLYTTPLSFIKIAGFYGYGLGTTYQGSIALGHNPHPYYLEEVTGGYEDEPERLMLEIGVTGFIMIYLLRLFYVFDFWKLFQKLDDYELRNLALIFLLFQLQFAVGLNVLALNHTSNLFYWYIMGFLFLLPRWDRQQHSE